ncbi:hypothetical protein BC833DRAFT_647282 [Globomyces pollinis-pini]|nr:hypothetical protein BC833DRAFT_647282 [Globomyces pollinis-pini]
MVETKKKDDFKWIQKSDMFSRFQSPETPKLPFKFIGKSITPPAPKQFYFKVFLVGMLMGGIIEGSMIKFGYYDQLVQGEAKRQAKKDSTPNV